MSVFIQRQFSGTLADGTVTSLIRVGPDDIAWEMTDVYPGNVLMIEPGLFSSVSTRIAADRAETHTAILPSEYSAVTANDRLCFSLSSDQDLLIAVTSPDYPATSLILYAPTGELGIYSVTQTVTSITLTNIGGDDATVSYFSFALPDITLAASWRDGSQVIGTVTT